MSAISEFWFLFLCVAVIGRRTTSHVINSVVQADVLEDDSGEEKMLQNIRTLILEKLDLKKPPKTGLEKPVLQTLNFSSETEEEIQDNLSEDDSQSFALFSEIDKPNNSTTRLRFHFSVAEHLNLVNSSKFELWLYKNNSADVLTLTQYFQNGKDESQQFKIRNQHLLRNWTRFEISPLVHEVVSHRETVLELEVTCIKGCPEDPVVAEDIEMKPFLVVIPGRTQHLRYKRRIDCSESNSMSNCCRHPLYVSFAAIGFDYWILEPKGYEAYFCKGSCRNEMGLARHSYSTIIMTLIEINRTAAENMGLQVSCSASKMSSINFIYKNDKDIIVQKSATDMVVEECDCS